jgi:tetratricopeptide (TPR) repeat protein
MPHDDNPAEMNQSQVAAQNLSAGGDIQIGQIVQKIVYLGLPVKSQHVRFVQFLANTLYGTSLLGGFLRLWRYGADWKALLMLLLGSGLLSLTCLYYAWFWKPEAQDKGDPGSEPAESDGTVQRQGTQHKSRQRTRRLAMVGIVAIPLLTAAGFLVWRSLPTPHVLLLVADFDGVEQQNYQVTETILRNLRSATQPYTDVKVRALNQTITEQQGSEVARAIGEQQKATIVIWGEYGATPTNVQISSHFELLNAPDEFSELEDTANGQTQTADIASMNSFQLQTHLSNEMSYLTLFTLGMVEYAKDNWDTAITLFGDALSQIDTAASSLNQSSLFFFRGTSYAYRLDYSKAIADYDQTIELQPNHVSAYTNRGAMHEAQEKYTEAIADYEQAIQLQPSLAVAYYNLGNVHSKQDNYDKAIAAYSKAIAYNSDYASAYNNRGVMYEAQGKYTEAIADYEQAIQLQPNLAEAYNNRGNAYKAEGDYTQAIDDYNQAIQLQPNYAEAYNNRGNTYKAEGDYTQAIDDYNQAIQLQPNYAEAYNNRGNAYKAEGDYTQAIDDYNQAIQLQPNYAGVYNNRGLAHADQGNYDQAFIDYKRAIQLQPDLAEVYNNLGSAYAASGNYAEAIPNFDQAIYLNPNYAMAYSNRGTAYKSQGDYEKAIADYGRLIELRPNDPIAHYYMASAYSLRGNVTEALVNLHRAITLDPAALEAAKTNADFDNLRQDERFQALIGQ